MMMAKVICVQLVSMLGFDFLFQDVDIVWFKNPLDLFSKKVTRALTFTSRTMVDTLFVMHRTRQTVAFTLFAIMNELNIS